MSQFVKLFISSMVIVIFLVIIGTFFYMAKIFNQIGDYHKNVLSNKEIMEKEVEYTQNININFNVANVRLDTSDDNNIHVKLFSDNPDNYKVELEDNVLNISLNVKEKKNIFKTDHLSLISVELPSDSESNITIKGNVGDVYFEEFPKAYANLDLDVSDVTIRDISEVKAKVNVGDINLYKVNNALDINLDAGDVIIGEITLDKDSSIKVNLGDVMIDKNRDFKIDAKTKMGNINVSGSNNDSDITLLIDVDAGDIDVFNIKDSYEKISDIEVFQRIKLEEVANIEITKYTEAGKATKTYTSNEDIFYYYNMIGNTKLGEKTEESCEDNTTIYTFNEKDTGKVTFEFECNNYLYNGYKLKVVE